MKRYVVISVLLLLNMYCHAQITFQKTYGGAQDDEFYSVQQTIDGGYILLGRTKSFGAGGNDVYLVKTDSLGDTLWTKTYGGTGSDVGNEVQQTTDSGFIIIGFTNSSGPTMVYLIKTDINGNTLWSKTYKPGVSGGGSSVKQTFDGGYILSCSGGTYGTGFLIKTNALGDTLWTKSFKINLTNSKILQTTDGGYIITGTGDDLTSYPSYLVLVKTDSNGNPVWKRVYKDTMINHGHSGYSVLQTPDGGYIALGNTGGAPSTIYLIKTNSLGDPLWTKSYRKDSSYGGGSCVIHTTDSGFVIAGTTENGTSTDVYLIKTDSIGNIIWSKSFGGSNSEWTNCMQQTTDGGYILAGKTNSFGAGGYDGYLIKTDANGNSGCFEQVVTTVDSVPVTIVSLPADTLLLGPVIVNSYSSIEGSGCMVNTLCITTTINEIEVMNLFSIYPNPSQGCFTVRQNIESKNAILSIYNTLGEKIYVTNLEHNYEIINCSKLVPGIYFISTITESKIITAKLIINK